MPHAGWICSGAVAGETIATLARAMPDAELVVVFGAIHSPYPTASAVLDPHRSWAVPGGQLQVPSELWSKLAERGEFFAVDERFHRREHAVEVELPLIRRAWPQALVLPVEVPVLDAATQIGLHTAQAVGQMQMRAVFLASSDLTHYGPAYGFVPAGVGPNALAWAKENDRRLLDVVMELAAERVVAEVRVRSNACGGGAIAAMLAAARELGATTAALLRHTNSYETLSEVVAQASATDAVGYASVVIG